MITSDYDDHSLLPTTHVADTLSLTKMQNATSSKDWKTTNSHNRLELHIIETIGFAIFD